jgi:hypothetical protein
MQYAACKNISICQELFGEKEFWTGPGLLRDNQTFI